MLLKQVLTIALLIAVTNALFGPETQGGNPIGPTVITTDSNGPAGDELLAKSLDDSAQVRKEVADTVAKEDKLEEKIEKVEDEDFLDLEDEDANDGDENSDVNDHSDVIIGDNDEEDDHSDAIIGDNDEEDDHSDAIVGDNDEEDDHSDAIVGDNDEKDEHSDAIVGDNDEENDGASDSLMEKLENDKKEAQKITE